MSIWLRTPDCLNHSYLHASPIEDEEIPSPTSIEQQNTEGQSTSVSSEESCLLSRQTQTEKRRITFFNNRDSFPLITINGQNNQNANSSKPGENENSAIGLSFPLPSLVSGQEVESDDLSILSDESESLISTECHNRNDALENMKRGDEQHLPKTPLISHVSQSERQKLSNEQTREKAKSLLLRELRNASFRPSIDRKSKEIFEKKFGGVVPSVFDRLTKATGKASRCHAPCRASSLCSSLAQHDQHDVHENRQSKKGYQLQSTFSKQTNVPIPDQPDVTENQQSKEGCQLQSTFFKQTNVPIPGQPDVTENQQSKEGYQLQSTFFKQTNVPIPDQPDVTENQQSKEGYQLQSTFFKQTNVPIPDQPDVTENQQSKEGCQLQSTFFKQTNVPIPGQPDVTENQQSKEGYQLQSTFSSRSSKQLVKGTFFERMKAFDEKKQQHLKQIAKEMKRQEAAKCKKQEDFFVPLNWRSPKCPTLEKPEWSFTPKLSKMSRILAGSRRLSSLLAESDRRVVEMKNVTKKEMARKKKWRQRMLIITKEEQKEKKKHLRKMEDFKLSELYNEQVENEKRLKREMEREIKEEERLNKEMVNCTFKPVINQSNVKAKYQGSRINGVDRYFARVALARRLDEQRQAENQQFPFNSIYYNSRRELY